MREKILEKIKKCLQLAGSDNPNEAALAMTKAQELMASYGVTVSDIELSEVMESKASAARQGIPPQWMNSLSHLICKCFGVERVYHVGDGTAYYTFVGLNSSSEIAAYVFDVLRRKISADRKAFYKSTRGKKVNRIRKADIFATFWVDAVRKKVRAFAMPERDERLVQNYIEQKYPALSTAKSRQVKMGRGDRFAAFLGHLAGSEVELQRGVSSSAQNNKLLG